MAASQFWGPTDARGHPFSIRGFKALPTMTPTVDTPRLGSPTPGEHPMGCEVTWPKGPGMASRDRGPHHLWERWVSPGPCTPTYPHPPPPVCCRVPAMVGRAADNPWQGWARRQGGRRKEQPPAAAPGSCVLALPHAPSRHRGHCCQGPTCRGYLCHRGKRPREPSRGGCSHTGSGARPCPGLQVTFHPRQRPGAPGCAKGPHGAAAANAGDGAQPSSRII